MTVKQLKEFLKGVNGNAEIKVVDLDDNEVTPLYVSHIGLFDDGDDEYIEITADFPRR